MRDPREQLISPLIAYLHLSNKEIEALLTLPTTTLETFVKKLHKRKALPHDEEIKTKKLLWTIWKQSQQQHGKIENYKAYSVWLNGTLLLSCRARAKKLYEIEERSHDERPPS